MVQITTALSLIEGLQKPTFKTKTPATLESNIIVTEGLSSNKQTEKRSVSNGMKQAKDLYFSENTKSSPIQSSNKKSKTAYSRYEDSSLKSLKSSKSKHTPYAPVNTNYYMSAVGTAGARIVKQHNMLKEHVDHKVNPNSFHYDPTSMFSPSNTNKGMNQSAILKKSSLVNNQSYKSRRMN